MFLCFHSIMYGIHDFGIAYHVFHDLTKSDRHGVCFILYSFKKHTRTLFGLVCIYTNGIHDVCVSHHLITFYGILLS